MRTQERILRRLAKEHGISVKHAKEIYHLMVQCIIDNMSKQDKRTDKGLYMVDKFKVIHIDNFGKFIPNTKRINYANYGINKKLENEDKLSE